MGGAVEEVVKPVSQVINTITNAAGQVVNAATGKPIAPPIKGGGKFSVTPVTDVLNKTNPMSLVNNIPAVNSISSEVGNAVNTVNQIPNKAMNAIGTAAQQTSAVGSKIIDQIGNIPNKLGSMFDIPKPPSAAKAVDRVGVTDVMGKRRKRTSQTDVRSGLAATILSKPQGLLGNAGGPQGPQGKAKLGQ